jgi:hypothetical protein
MTDISVNTDETKKTPSQGAPAEAPQQDQSMQPAKPSDSK